MQIQLQAYVLLGMTVPTLLTPSTSANSTLLIIVALRTPCLGMESFPHLGEKRSPAPKSDRIFNVVSSILLTCYGAWWIPTVA